MIELNIDPYSHYKGFHGPIEYSNLPECEVAIKNIGWTLGNDCPYRCKHCYSMSARIKGQNFNKKIIDRVVNQLQINSIETVNLGGNEPLYTNGIDPKKSLLPYIIDKLCDSGIRVGITTSGISVKYLEKYHKQVFTKLNDIDVSLDSPYEFEHNLNRGGKLYQGAIEVLKLCDKYKIEHTIIMCAMKWNFTNDRIIALIKLAKEYNSNVRINPIKPVESSHYNISLTASQYYSGFSLLHELCIPIDLGEPPIATMTNYQLAKGCPCGRTSFRIHSITPDGKIPVSPCVYLHDYKVGDLAVDNLYDIIHSESFKIFRIRNANPNLISGCEGCDLIRLCRGGCAARSYLHTLHKQSSKTLFKKDPFCPKENLNLYKFETVTELQNDKKLVHSDYLCTWIGKPI